MSRDNALFIRLRLSPHDEALWTAFYETLYPQVYVFAFRLCKASSDLARDVTQEAFVRFISAAAIRKVSSTAAALAYLRAIVRNLVRDHYRKSMQHPTVSAENVETDDLERALERTIRRTITEVDLLAVPDLRESDRQLLQLALEGRSVTEVAEQMGVSYSAAAVRLHRLRNHLRTICKESDPEHVLVDK